MRTCCMLLAATALILALLAGPAQALVESASTNSGAQTLADLGVSEARDIEFVLVKYASGENYLISNSRAPDLVQRLYSSLVELGPYVSKPPIGDWNIILIHAKNDVSAWLPFYCEVSGKDATPTCYISGTRHSADLDKVLADIHRNAQAARQGACVGDFSVREMIVRTPESAPAASVPACSAEYRAILSVTRTIIDWLDLRTIAAQRIDAEDVADSERKQGSLTLVLDQPISLRVLSAAPSVEENRPGGFYRSIALRNVSVSAILITDREGCKPPVVLLRDTSGTSYPYDKLTRRQQERTGVSSYGLPGHPVSDTEYYKSPKLLYEELRALTKAAYEEYGPKQSTTDND